MFCLLNSIQSKSRFHWLDPLLWPKVVIGEVYQGLCGTSLTPIDTVLISPHSDYCNKDVLKQMENSDYLS